MEKRILFEGEFLDLIREGHWEYVRRVNATGAAVIIAVSHEGKLLLVEQYRIPVHSRTIELPAGIIGDETEQNESSVEGARRELLEETGYSADRIESLITGPVSSGLGSELITFYRASGLKKIGQGGGVANEEIIVHEVATTQVHDWLQEKVNTGILIDPKIYAGLYFIEHPCWAAVGIATSTKAK